MEYPRKNHFLRFKRVSMDRVEIRNYLSGEIWEMDIRYARFLKALDGNTNPYKINPNLRKEFVDKMLEYFEKEECLNSKKRIMSAGIGTIFCTLCIPDIHKKHRILAQIWNRLLMIFFIPILMTGMGILFSNNWLAVDHGFGNLTGYLIGIGAGMILHELSHACACLSYGGYWFEGGGMLYHFLPGAYVCIDYDNVRNRFQRAQILAAGVECNLALAGMFLIFLKAGIFDSNALVIAAMVNIIIGLFNFSLIEGLDGMGIFANFLGEEEIVKKAMLLICNRRAKKELRRRGSIGKATITGCYIVVFFQILFPIMLILNAVGIYNIFMS